MYLLYANFSATVIMEYYNLNDNFSIGLLATALSVASFFLVLILKKPRENGNKRPPGPTGWPLFGNIFDLGMMPHESLRELKSKFGPVIWLKLGSMNSVVIQSAGAASELFKHHDLAFSDRKVPDVLSALDHKEGSLAFREYGDYWRTVRRLCSSEILLTRRLDQTAVVREKCMDKMILWIGDAAAKDPGGEVHLAHFLFIMAFNLIGNMMISKDVIDPTSKEWLEFYDATNNMALWVGTPNIADFLPFLKWIDPQRIRRNMARDLGRSRKILSLVVKERIEANKQSGGVVLEEKRDFLDVLLEHQEIDKISERDMHTVILEMFVAGAETTSMTIEWAMSELVRNPEIMEKLKQELDQYKQTQSVKESDMKNLPYLQAVIKETLRLHPASPFLLPRSAREDTKYMGYLIPKDTQILINAWAIARDPETWDDPETFKPERFLGSSIDYKGQDFKYLPFGSGRRICVGNGLADRVLHLSLAALILSFDWKLGNGETPETIDMKGTIGLTLRKVIPLKVKPKSRRIKE